MWRSIIWPSYFHRFWIFGSTTTHAIIRDMDNSKSLDPTSMPWIPLCPGQSFKPLRFFPNDRGRVLLLRVEPGTVVALHRHLGEVHGFHLAGARKLDSIEIVGPGVYVYEPAGNVDSWEAVGD